MHVFVGIQARSGSTRLPGKVLKPFAGYSSMLAFMWKRLSRHLVRKDERVCVLAPARDLDVVVEAQNISAPVSRPATPEHDVLGRFYDATRFNPPDVVVRLTADCPFVDPWTINSMVDRFCEGGCDYLSNCHPVRTMPKGFDVEVFSFDALRRLHFETSPGTTVQMQPFREHVTGPFYDAWQQWPTVYRTDRYDPEVGMDAFAAQLNLSVDTQEDFDRAERVARMVGPFGFWEDYVEAARNA